jgi:hypothetical protein
MPPPIDKWSKVVGFSYMRKSFAEGAWAMLKAHYNQSYEQISEEEIRETLEQMKTMETIFGKDTISWEENMK